MTPPPLLRQGLLEISPHRHVAILRANGTPIAYLPPDEMARRFDLYRDFLRSLDQGFVSLATTTPIRAQSVRPSGGAGAGQEGRAQSGYIELVQLLCRRRQMRRVYFVVGALDSGPDALSRIEARAAGVVEALTRLGLRPVRLRDQSLTEAARRLGWPVELGVP